MEMGATLIVEHLHQSGMGRVHQRQIIQMEVAASGIKNIKTLTRAKHHHQFAMLANIQQPALSIS